MKLAEAIAYGVGTLYVVIVPSVHEPSEDLNYL